MRVVRGSRPEAGFIVTLGISCSATTTSVSSFWNHSKSTNSRLRSLHFRGTRQARPCRPTLPRSLAWPHQMRIKLLATIGRRPIDRPIDQWSQLEYSHPLADTRSLSISIRHLGATGGLASSVHSATRWCPAAWRTSGIPLLVRTKNNRSGQEPKPCTQTHGYLHYR